jgi:purine-cytosine permease-like protein
MAIEQRGIDAISREERTKRWWDLFTTQAGIAFSFPALVIGSLRVPGLSWPHAIWVNLIANSILAARVALAGHHGDGMNRISVPRR